MNSNKIVLQLVTSINLGGAENIAINLAEDCNEKLEFIIVELYSTTSTFAKVKKTQLKEKNIKLLSLSKYSKRLSLIIAPINLFILLLKIKPDIIHSHTDLPDFVLAIVIKIRNFIGLHSIKIVRTIHNTALWPTHSKIGKFTESAYKNDFVVSISESTEIAYIELRSKYYLEKSKNKLIIYNGCKIPEFENAEFILDKTKINILFCGRLEYQKGIDILLDRIQEINLKLPGKYDFHIVGSGFYKKDVNFIGNKYSNVLVYDSINDISNKMHGFDFLIMPSRFEGLVLTSIEASLSRIPVISSGVAGLKETLPENWPLNFELNNSESLLSLMEKIAQKKIDVEKLKNEANSYVEKKFSYLNMVSKYSRLYDTILL